MLVVRDRLAAYLPTAPIERVREFPPPEFAGQKFIKKILD
jgi:hypothetical protein